MAGTALKGIKVVELEGIGPGPLAACILADFGADVVMVARAVNGKIVSQNDPVSRGKRSIALDLKSKEGMDTLLEMVKQADVFIEPFRPGVAEKLGLGPDVLCALNPRLIYGRMTGWGQGGDPKIEKSAGHDANYLAIAGTLDLFRRGDERPQPPANFAGDYAGGGVMLAMGTAFALLERQNSGKGQVIDAAMTDGSSYVALPLMKWLEGGVFLQKNEHGELNPNLSVLNQGSHFTETYLCKPDPKKNGRKEYMSVQSIEPQFYSALLKGLGVDEKEPGLPKQMDRENWGMMKMRLGAIFRTKVRDEWAEIFRGTDACTAPVLNVEEAWHHPHNVARNTFGPSPGRPGKFEPNPAPKLSRTPGALPRRDPEPGEHTREVLREIGKSEAQVNAMLQAGQALSKL